MSSMSFLSSVLGTESDGSPSALTPDVLFINDLVDILRCSRSTIERLRRVEHDLGALREELVGEVDS